MPLRIDYETPIPQMLLLTNLMKGDVESNTDFQLSWVKKYLVIAGLNHVCLWFQTEVDSKYQLHSAHILAFLHNHNDTHAKIHPT